ncbi:MAG: hypothetical protein LBC25_00725 [Holosporales bacterium]|jgi:hypothetical protein|nr:hypothetical protein [Holosporales bacterium]
MGQNTEQREALRAALGAICPQILVKIVDEREIASDQIIGQVYNQHKGTIKLSKRSPEPQLVKIAYILARQTQNAATPGRQPEDILWIDSDILVTHDISHMIAGCRQSPAAIGSCNFYFSTYDLSGNSGTFAPYGGLKLSGGLGDLDPRSATLALSRAAVDVDSDIPQPPLPVFRISGGVMYFKLSKMQTSSQAAPSREVEAVTGISPYDEESFFYQCALRFGWTIHMFSPRFNARPNMLRAARLAITKQFSPQSISHTGQAQAAKWLRTDHSIETFREILTLPEVQQREWMAVIHWDSKAIKKPFLVAAKQQHSSWANRLWHNEYREVWCSLLLPSARKRWEDAGVRTYVPQSIQIELERDILRVLPTKAILRQLPLPSALLETEKIQIRALQSQRILNNIAEIIDAWFGAALPYGVYNRYNTEQDAAHTPIQIAALPDQANTHAHGVELEITDGEVNPMRARVYGLLGHPTPYLRIPVPTRHDLCGIFALGPPPPGVTAEQIVELLQENGLIDQMIADDHPIWQQLANLYGARIVWYREADIEGVPTVIATNIIAPDGWVTGQRTLRIIGEPGHYNALVCITDTTRIREFIRLNHEQGAQGWYPLFRL